MKHTIFTRFSKLALLLFSFLFFHFIFHFHFHFHNPIYNMEKLTQDLKANTKFQNTLVQNREPQNTWQYYFKTQLANGIYQ